MASMDARVPELISRGRLETLSDGVFAIVVTLLVLELHAPHLEHATSVPEATDALLRDLNRHARARLGSAVAPREIQVIDILPKTRSGKIMRRLLKARELGLPEGDTSTLEED